jgi:hypothetical protein
VNESTEPLQFRSPEDERLDTLFRAYHSACEPAQVSPNFMPELWQKIERVQNATFSFRRIAQGFVTAAAALSLVLAVVGFFPSHQNSLFYNASYVDALAAHTDALAAHSGADNAEYVDLLLHGDTTDDVEEI